MVSDEAEYTVGGTDDPFPLVDHHQRYLLSLTTTSEQQITTERAGDELAHLRSQPPARRIFDTGTSADTQHRGLRFQNGSFVAVHSGT